MSEQETISEQKTISEQETILAYQDQPYPSLLSYLLSHGYRATGHQSDTKHNLNKMIFIAHNRTKHMKVVVWYMWLKPNQYGIAEPGLVTDIECKDLEPKEIVPNVRPD